MLTDEDLKLMQFNDGTLKPIEFTFQYDIKPIFFGRKKQEGSVTLDFMMLRNILDNMNVYDVIGIIAFGSVVDRREKKRLQKTWFGKEKEVSFLAEPQDLDLLILTQIEHNIQIQSPIKMIQYIENNGGYGPTEKYRTVLNGLDLFVMTEEQLENGEASFKNAIYRYGKLLVGKMPHPA